MTQGFPTTALTRLGLERPTDVEPLTGRSGSYLVRFASRDPLLVRQVPESPWRSASHALVGMAAADGIPTSTSRMWVGPGLWLTDVPDGERRVDVPGIEAVLQVLEALDRIEAPRFGARAGASSFWPHADTWSEAVLRRARFHRARCGFAPHLAAHLLERVEAGREALDGCSRFTLVHGQLSPVELWLHDAPTLTDAGVEGVTVTGWDRAHFGDPIEDLIELVRGPPAAVEAVRPRIEALDDAARARLDVYLAVAWLDRLADASNPEQAGQRIAQITARLDHLEAGWTPADGPLPLASPARTALNQQLLALPAATPEGIDETLGKIAMCVLALKMPEHAEALLQRVGSPIDAWIPHGDRDESSPASLEARLDDADARRPRNQAALFLGRQVEALGCPMPWTALNDLAPALDALDALWWAAMLDDGADKPAELVEGLFAGVNGGAHAEAALHRARRAAAKLEQRELLLQGYDTAVGPTVERLTGAALPDAQSWMVFSLLLALEVLHEDHAPFVLPDSVAHWLGL